MHAIFRNLYLPILIYIQKIESFHFEEYTLYLFTDWYMFVNRDASKNTSVYYINVVEPQDMSIYSSFIITQ